MSLKRFEELISNILFLIGGTGFSIFGMYSIQKSNHVFQTFWAICCVIVLLRIFFRKIHFSGTEFVIVLIFSPMILFNLLVKRFIIQKTSVWKRKQIEEILGGL